MNNLPHKKPKGKKGMAMVKKLGHTYKTGMFSKIAASAKAAGKTNNWLMGVWGGYENQLYCEGWVGANSDVAGTTNPYVWSAVVNSTSSLWKNGTLVKTGTGGVTAPAGLTIGYQGTSEFSDGDIGEIIAYNRALSDAERVVVENYLKTKWGIS